MRYVLAEAERRLTEIEQRLSEMERPSWDDVFPPLDAATHALTARIKRAFDPARTLNPGRMYKDV